MKIIPVDKNALLNDLSAIAVCIDDYNYEVYSEVLDMIDQAPALDYAPVVHTQWKISADQHYFYCSECHFSWLGHTLSAYCPHCDARMDEPTVKFKTKQ